MLWARIGVAGGLLMVAAAFGLGVQPASTSVDRHSYSCASVIPTSWLVPGSPDPWPTAGSPGRVQAKCQGVVQRDRELMWGAIFVGGLVALVGWTTMRELDASVRRRGAGEPAVSA